MMMMMMSNSAVLLHSSWTETAEVYWRRKVAKKWEQCLVWILWILRTCNCLLLREI